MLHIDPATVAAITPSAVLSAIEAHERTYGAYLYGLCDKGADLGDLREAERAAFHELVHVTLANDAERVAYAVALIARENSPLGRLGEGRGRNDPLAVAFRNLSFGEHAWESEGGPGVVPLAGDTVDPLLAAIAESRKTHAASEEFYRQHSGSLSGAEMDVERALNSKEYAARCAVWKTRPTTQAGRRALVEFARQQIEAHSRTDGTIETDGVLPEIFGALATMVEVETAPRQPAAHEPSRALAAMMAEWTALDDKMGTTRRGLTDAEMDRHGELHLAIYRFPAASLADLHAKLPLFRAEMGASEEYVVDGRNPKDVLCYASWLGVVTDLERLGGQARPTSTLCDPDPIRAAIGESREAMRRRNKAGAPANRDPRFERAWTTATDGSRRAWDTVLATRPTTLSGLQALARHALDWCADQGDEGPETADLRTVLATISDCVLGVLPVATPPRVPAAVSEAADDRFATDLGACSIADLARLYEQIRTIWHVVGSTSERPCFWDGTREFYTPAGEILNRESDRMAGLLSAVAAEVVRRAPADADERNEALAARIAHELECEGRIAEPDLMRDVIDAWAPSRVRGTTRAAAQRAGR